MEAAKLLGGRPAVVLTGAGVSTDSGIPDYRGAGSPRRSPMTYADFMSGEPARQRYWARSHLGWRRLSEAEPNEGHRALTELEQCGAVTAVITQNVDGLHRAAGSREVVELHGRVSDVLCLDCRASSSRSRLQDRLAVLNPSFAAQPVTLAPDGDAELESVGGFVVAPCELCGGVLKPDVVFFGENVPAYRVGRAMRLTEAAQAMLVAGSSLAVLSGYRFVRYAAELGIPIVIVNRGPTRADDLATLKIDAGCSEALSELAASLSRWR